MSNRHGLAARIAPTVGSMFAFFSFVAACSDGAESEPFIGETGSLAWCTSDAGCESTDPDTTEPVATEPQTDWLVRCTSDSECAIGQCVCGLCTASCTGDEPSACGGVPEGASCFAGGTTARAAVCHASTVPGICLPPCNAGDDCGDGFICALGACLPRPPAR